MMKSFALNEHALMLSAVFSHSVSVVRFRLFFFSGGRKRHRGNEVFDAIFCTETRRFKKIVRTVRNYK